MAADARDWHPRPVECLGRRLRHVSREQFVEAFSTKVASGSSSLDAPAFEAYGVTENECGNDEELVSCVAHAAYDLPLSASWSEEVDDRGRIYFWHSARAEASWDHPAMASCLAALKVARRLLAAPSTAAAEAHASEYLAKLQARLTEELQAISGPHMSAEGRPYWHVGGQSTWEDPTEAPKDDVRTQFAVLAQVLDNHQLRERRSRLGTRCPPGQEAVGTRLAAASTTASSVISWPGGGGSAPSSSPLGLTREDSASSAISVAKLEEPSEAQNELAELKAQVARLAADNATLKQTAELKAEAARLAADNATLKQSVHQGDARGPNKQGRFALSRLSPAYCAQWLRNSVSQGCKANAVSAIGSTSAGIASVGDHSGASANVAKSAPTTPSLATPLATPEASLERNWSAPGRVGVQGSISTTSSSSSTSFRFSPTIAEGGAGIRQLMALAAQNEGASRAPFALGESSLRGLGGGASRSGGGSGALNRSLTGSLGQSASTGDLSSWNGGGGSGALNRSLGGSLGHSASTGDLLPGHLKAAAPHLSGLLAGQSLLNQPLGQVRPNERPLPPLTALPLRRGQQQPQLPPRRKAPPSPAEVSPSLGAACAGFMDPPRCSNSAFSCASSMASTAASTAASSGRTRTTATPPDSVSSSAFGGLRPGGYAKKLAACADLEVDEVVDYPVSADRILIHPPGTVADPSSRCWDGRPGLALPSLSNLTAGGDSGPPSFR
eukprot:TRINITY_DN3647_c0_g1_i1.p1 TRINITY_DN3647_c0_g1~~TRINITY_DN3647_c0_g1_i1.p1  ORF type:complete len:760 (+),score=123.97 TRINITY_DN3647_c0_g1_i1:99-2282(+)